MTMAVKNQWVRIRMRNEIPHGLKISLREKTAMLYHIPTKILSLPMRKNWITVTEGHSATGMWWL